ncbi:uncharacterized protein LOC134265197 [Saccostrea cucullata]|uniref:uncharacterized protein LOC134265197 n=1 Tax=Saccostrea cuccullata TaxID=36930 RepID=UPI002ED5E7A9
MLDSKSKLILTSRKTVFMEAKRFTFLNSFTYKVFDLGDDENELTKQDKLSILSAYEIDINPLEQELQKVVGESDVFHMFPLLCKLFSTNLEYKRKGCSFFKEPYPIIMKHLDEMEKERRLFYAALVLCMLNEGLISENVLDTELVPKKTIYRCCKIQSSTDNWEIMEAVSQMVGTYLTECDGEFYFVHDLLFEIVACHFGKKCPKEIIDLMTSEFISQRLTLEDKQEEGFLTIKISEREYNKLAERLYGDLKNLKLYSVFDSEFLHNEKIGDHFLSLLSRDTNIDIKDFFLSLNTDFKDYTTMRMPNKKTLDSTEELHFNMKMLIEDAGKVFWFYEDEEFGAYSNNCQIRLISWIIAFGHNKILKYIVDQMISRNEELEIVFGKDLMSQTRCLVLACYSKNPDIVKLVLKHTDPTCRNMNTHQEEESVCIPMYKLITPLTLSILLESSDILDIILDEEVNVNAFGVTCLSPLLIAIYRSDLNTVQKLVAAGANVNQCSCDEFPLIVGSMLNNTEIVEFLELDRDKAEPQEPADGTSKTENEKEHLPYHS